VLEGQAKDNLAGIVRLPNTDVDAFQAFYSWIYTHRLFDPPKERQKKVPLESTALCKIFTLGDFLGTACLKNAAVDALMDKVADEGLLSGHCVNYVYANTSRNSPLRELILDFTLTVWMHEASWHAAHRAPSYPTEYLMDIIGTLRLREPWSKESWSRVSRCRFHDHSTSGSESCGTVSM